MKVKKILILLPDGVGLRNFAFTSFVAIGAKMGWEVIFWNHTPYNLSESGYQEIPLHGKPRAKTDLLKRAKIEAELDHFTEKFQEPIYQTYKFPPSNIGLKAKIKNRLVAHYKSKYAGEKELQQLRHKMKASERKGAFYRYCKEVLQKEQPDFVFCTNQRPVNAIAPLTAAQDLGIPTGSFIFSWDNLPKATMVVQTDHYFVWSEHMKKELLGYYPFVASEKIHITGSPQFEPHFDLSLRKSRKDFFGEYGLDPEKKYICFSGDDITTSPDDPQYLRDLAETVQQLNSTSNQLGIIFRRCPVDFSSRYDRVLEDFEDLIAPIAPKWQKSGENWNTILPTKADLKLQINTILHSEAVVNLASSMVFDFAVFNKPCFYLNYDVPNKVNESWCPGKVYNFIHFRSMSSKDAVIWLDSKEEIKKKLKFVLNGSTENVKKAQEWFEKINLHPPQKASERIWEAIDRINTIGIEAND